MLACSRGTLNRIESCSIAEECAEDVQVAFSHPCVARIVKACESKSVSCVARRSLRLA